MLIKLCFRWLRDSELSDLRTLTKPFTRLKNLKHRLLENDTHILEVIFVILTKNLPVIASGTRKPSEIYTTLKMGVEPHFHSLYAFKLLLNFDFLIEKLLSSSFQVRSSLLSDCTMQTEKNYSCILKSEKTKRFGINILATTTSVHFLSQS